MDIQVVEGQFLQVPTADAGGMERRAFGEFVGLQGELASYAFGWTTGSEPQVARMSIGIGAGNPGGGTFHVVVFDHEDGHAFSLTDEPFEHVPQGGPDLTVDQARAHEALPFVWWVADHIMERDRRARWMRHWLVGTRCIQTIEVFERRAPIPAGGQRRRRRTLATHRRHRRSSHRQDRTPPPRSGRRSDIGERPRLTARPAARAEPAPTSPGPAISATRSSRATAATSATARLREANALLLPFGRRRIGPVRRLRAPPQDSHGGVALGVQIVYHAAMGADD